MDMLHSIWNLSDQSDINRKQDRQLAAADSSLQAAHRHIRDLQVQVGNLAATCQALCSLLVEKLGVSPEEVKDAIEQAMSLNAVSASGTCPSCNHPFDKGRTACLYCGFKPSPDVP